MSLQRKLRMNPEDWRHPRWARFAMPAGGGLGGLLGAAASTATAADGVVDPLLAGAGAAIGVIVAWIVAAALD